MKSFNQIVIQSRVLTSEQKELLLTDPELPEEYRRKITKMLAKFDEHSKVREAYLRDKLQELHTEFIKELEDVGIEVEKKKDLLDKARKQIESFFPKNQNQS